MDTHKALSFFTNVSAIMDALKAENAALKRQVALLEDTLKAVEQLYDEKVRYAEEEGTRAKLAAIQSQIGEAVRMNLVRIHTAIEAARKWGDEHNVMEREVILGIIERALPR